MEEGTLTQWFWALFGVLIYNYLSFNIEKDRLDESKKKFSFKSYARVRWDNWVWSFLCVPVVVYKGDDLWYYVMEYFEKEWEFRPVLYLSAGIVAEGFYYLFKKALGIIKALGNVGKTT